MDAGQERRRHLTDGAAGRDGPAERVRAGLQGQVVELDLHRHGAGRARCAPQHGGHRFGHAQHVALQHGGVDQVVAEGLLVADRLGRAVGRHRAGVLAPGQCGQVEPAGLAQAAHQRCRAGGRPARPPCAHPESCRRSAVAGPTPHSASTGGRAGTPSRRSGSMRTTPGPGSMPGPGGARLGRPRGQLGDHLGATDPHGTVQGELGAHPVPQSVGDHLGRPEQAQRPGHVEEGLVEPDRFDQRGDVLHDVVELAADLGVATVAPGQEHGLGAELAGPDRRHGRAHAEGAGLVGARRHHAAGGRPADDDRQPGQGRVVEDLDRGEEGVHVDVQNGGDVGERHPRSVRRRKPSA